MNEDIIITIFVIIIIIIIIININIIIIIIIKIIIIIIIIIKIEPPHGQTVSQLKSIVFNDSFLYLGVDDISCSVILRPFKQ